MPGRGFLQGSIATKEGFTGNSLSQPAPLEAAGKQDGETGWQYFGARYYHPALGKWLGVDYMADIQPNVTPYHYVQNNPINRFDPDGMKDTTYTVPLLLFRVRVILSTITKEGMMHLSVHCLGCSASMQENIEKIGIFHLPFYK